MTIYISGPITGMPDGNRAAFREAEAALAEEGIQSINPHCVPAASDSWVDHMRADIKRLVDCDSILMLDGWQESRGAAMEYRIARALGLQTYDMTSSIIAGASPVQTDGKK